MERHIIAGPGDPLLHPAAAMRMIGTIIIGVAIAFAGLTGLLYVNQERMVFLPEVGGTEYAGTPRLLGLAFEEVALTTSDGETLAAWFVPADRPRGAVLFCHGNAGNISHRLDFLLMFHRMGYATLIFDYRGYGRSTGRPSESGAYLDAQAGWDYLVETRGIPPGRIVLYGESLGGAVAAHLAEKEQPGALVIASAFTSVPELGTEIYPFLPVRLLARIRLDARDSLSRVRAPVLVAHSPGDEIVPFAHGEALYRAAHGPKAMLRLSGGHNTGFIFMREDWVAELKAFLDAHLGGAANAKAEKAAP